MRCWCPLNSDKEMLRWCPALLFHPCFHSKVWYSQSLHQLPASTDPIINRNAWHIKHATPGFFPSATQKMTSCSFYSERVCLGSGLCFDCVSATADFLQAANVASRLPIYSAHSYPSLDRLLSLQSWSTANPSCSAVSEMYLLSHCSPIWSKSTLKPNSSWPSLQTTNPAFPSDSGLSAGNCARCPSYSIRMLCLLLIREVSALQYRNTVPSTLQEWSWSQQSLLLPSRRTTQLPTAVLKGACVNNSNPHRQITTACSRKLISNLRTVHTQQLQNASTAVCSFTCTAGAPLLHRIKINLSYRISILFKASKSYCQLKAFFPHHRPKITLYDGIDSVLRNSSCRFSTMCSIWLLYPQAAIGTMNHHHRDAAPALSLHPSYERRIGHWEKECFKCACYTKKLTSITQPIQCCPEKLHSTSSK